MNALLVFIFALMPYCLLATDDYQYDAPPHGGRRPVDVEIGEDYYEDNKPYYYPGEYERTPGYNQGNYGCMNISLYATMQCNDCFFIIRWQARN